MPAELVIRKPVNASMAEASGLAGVGCTAIQAAEAASLKPGDKVFVNGGSGGLGSMMVQVARAIVGESGQVIATCSGPNVEMVKALGADEVCFDSKNIWIASLRSFPLRIGWVVSCLFYISLLPRSLH